MTLALALLGISLLNQKWIDAAASWLQTDWHWLTALLGMLFLGAALALYGVEREEDARSTVRLLSDEVESDLRQQLGVDKGRAVRDALILTLTVRFYNAGDKPRRVRFPSLELQRRENSRLWPRRWQPLPLDLRDPHIFTRMHLRGRPNHNTIWYRDKPFEIPALDELSALFSIVGTSPEGATAFINRRLRIKVSVDIIGQPRPGVLYLPVTVTGYRT